MGTEILRLPLAPDAEYVEQLNLVGFRSKEVLFSRRLDSRTYFVQDFRPEKPESKPAPEQIARQYAEEIMRRLEIPLAEVAQQRLVEEHTNAAQVDRSTGRLQSQKEQIGKGWFSVTRQIDGLPVFSSRMLLQVGDEHSIKFMELHWPEIPLTVVVEAHRLAYKVKAGWKPPNVEGAEPEAVDAGMIHSPAVGFVMDTYAAIRVIYRPLKAGVGKKTVLYLDRSGHPVAMPRQFAEPPKEEPRTKRESKVYAK
ncbi:MAG TPA: hypothetical protein VG759_27410 [Candidatus Angelobacter sp.]|nr:hypothetical protein [Candidatus Angelobacter sp.]